MSITDNINNNLPITDVCPLSYLGPRNRNTFFVSHTSTDEVFSVKNSFVTKGCNIKSIPVFIYEYLNSSISPIIESLFNASVIEGLFSEC